MASLLVLVFLVAFLIWLATPRHRRVPGAEVEPVDEEELGAAEREVRDLGADQRPEDGWEGDDWGPGAAGRGRG